MVIFIIRLVHKYVDHIDNLMVRVVSDRPGWTPVKTPWIPDHQGYLYSGWLFEMVFQGFSGQAHFLSGPPGYCIYTSGH